MVVFSRFRIFTVVLVCIFGGLLALPNLLREDVRVSLPQWMQRTVSLGLDLRGGSHIQLEVDIHTATKEFLANILGEIRKTLRKQQIKYKNLRLDAKSELTAIRLTLIDKDSIEAASKLIKKINTDLDVAVNGAEIEASLPQKAIIQRNIGVVEQSIEVVRRRIDATGTKEPNIQRKGDNRIVVQLPGVGDPTEIRRLLGTTAKLSFQWVDESVQPIVESKGSKVYLPVPPVGVNYVPEERPDGTVVYIPIKKQIIIHGDSLVDAQASFDGHGQPVVSIKFNNVGKQQMYEASKNVKKQFAIVLDNKVISAPVFQEAIPGGNAQISGHFTVAEANELALLLRAGALPAPLKVVEECTVGPSLGEDSIAHGKIATVFAFLIVAVFMCLVYFHVGFLADIALAVNVMLLFAGLSLLGATLTLPGIAGIALTIGMAVDANVLIFERIREELRSGVRLIVAIDQGYKRAFSAIFDSNLTTIIGAWILYYYSTGAVKGFAVTLALGVVISMFTALTLTQMFLVAWVKMFRLKRLPI
ncbi:MAG: protein translocase subunit SecD [Holosporales bacterium]|nr:protein translocase subunit SecD [Holosporales bacterium]